MSHRNAITFIIGSFLIGAILGAAFVRDSQYYAERQQLIQNSIDAHNKWLGECEKL